MPINTDAILEAAIYGNPDDAEELGVCGVVWGTEEENPEGHFQLQREHARVAFANRARRRLAGVAECAAITARDAVMRGDSPEAVARAVLEVLGGSPEPSNAATQPVEEQSP